MSNHISGGNAEVLVGRDFASNKVSSDPETVLDNMADAPNGARGNYRRGNGVKVG